MDENLIFKKSEQGLKKQMDDCIEIMSVSIVLADLVEIESFNTVIATQLRLLLCDTFKRKKEIFDNSLILKVVSNPKLPPLTNDYLEITTDNSKGRFINRNNMFNEEASPIDLNTWRKQILYYIDGNISITIEDIIKTYANKQGGAHVDGEITGTQLFSTIMAEKSLSDIAKCIIKHLGYDWKSISVEILTKLHDKLF